MTYNLVPEKLYDYNGGVRCGVFVPEHVMKKLAKLQAKHLESVKKLLIEYKDELYSSSWTLYRPDGKQTTVRYADTSVSVEDRIKNAVYNYPPTYCPTVYISDSMDDAKRQAEERFEETGEAE